MSKSAFKNITRGVRLRLLAHRKYGTPFDDILRSPVVHGAAFDNAFCSAASSPLPPHGLQPPPSASAGFVFDASTLPSVPFHQTMADQFRLFASGKPADWSNSVFKQATRGVRLRLLAHRKYWQPTVGWGRCSLAGGRGQHFTSNFFRDRFFKRKKMSDMEFYDVELCLKK